MLILEPKVLQTSLPNEIMNRTVNIQVFVDPTWLLNVTRKHAHVLG